MALILSDDEQQLQGSVRRLVADRSPLAKLRELMNSGQPFDPDVWKQIAALGLPGLIVSEEHGGAEAGYGFLAVALAELGGGLVASPLLASTLSAAALTRLGDSDAAGRLLPGIASGEHVVTLALGGAGSVTADGDTLNGELSPVLNAGQADVLLIPAGGALFEVAAGATGVTVTPLTAVDHSRSLGSVKLDGVSAKRLGGDAAAALSFATDVANLATAAEDIGGMAAALNMVTEYAKIRLAFGQPIGSYQGVKHRIAELWTQWELAQAALRDAAAAADERPTEFPLAASTARIAVSANYVEASVANIQLHGGIGFTWEHDAHLYQKNAMSQHVLFSTANERLDRLNAQLA